MKSTVMIGERPVCQGLVSSTGRAAYMRGTGECSWKFGLPDDMGAFGILPGESPVASSDGIHWACVAVGPDGRHVAIASMQSPVVDVFRKPFAGIYGMSWSRDGRMLCVAARDPSVGVIAIDKAAELLPPSVCSLFIVTPDRNELIALAGPIAAPGIPRWSPTGTAVATIGLEHGGKRSVIIVTLDGRVEPVMAGAYVTLGDNAWTPDGHLLCAVGNGDREVIPCMVDPSRGSTSQLSDGWQGITTLTIAGDNSTVLAGKREDSWCVARISGETTDVVVPMASAPCTAVAGSRLWFVGSVRGGRVGLWTSDLGGKGPELKLTATSMKSLRVHPSGLAAAVMTGGAGKETVCAISALGDMVDNVGRRDVIWGWSPDRPPEEFSSGPRRPRSLR